VIRLASTSQNPSIPESDPKTAADKCLLTGQFQRKDSGNSSKEFIFG
jgi:hypothetical protein